MDHSFVLFFDSGLGGLTVVSETIRKIPNIDIIYAFDNAYFPYGLLPESVVIDRCKTIIDSILRLHSVNLIVIACNTASTVVLPYLRQIFDIPIVGVVPAIKPAASLTKTKTIGLLATPATITREYTKKLVEQFASECNVVKVGDPNLVKYAEEKLLGRKINISQIKNSIKDFFNYSDIDVVVLGCTHYPWIKDEICTLLPNVTCIDSGFAIANRVKNLLENDDKYTPNEVFMRKAYMTDKKQIDKDATFNIFKNFGFESLEDINDY